MTEVTFDYEPREAFLPFHSRSQRWSVMVCHRRAGKTVACINDLIAKAVYTKKKNARFAYIAPFYRQAKDVAWEYLKQYAAPVIRGRPKESTLRVELFNGAWITLYGADNPDAFRGMYFDGLIIDEYGDMRPKLWTENLLPTLADRRGWAAFIGTPKGPNHFKDTWVRALENPQNWFSFMLKASESGILPEEELAMMKAEMSEDEYAQELECSFEAAVTGTYYASLLNEHRDKQCEVPYDPNFPVQLAMDIGRTDAAAGWFWQERPDGVAMIYHHEKPGTDPAYWFKLCDDLGYEFSDIWLPHDAKAQTFATKRSTLEQFIDKFGNDVHLVPKLSRQDGIAAARLMIPITWFHLPDCQDGLDCLKNYRREWNDIKKVFSDRPLHDWSSDSADAFRYFAIVAKQRYGHRSRAEAERAANQHIKRYVQPEPITLDGLWKDRDAARANRDILRIR